MAKVPAYLKGFNGIVRLLENSCEDPWTVYAETAFPALGKAFITILLFGFDDIMRGFFRPTKSLRSRRHGRGGKKGRKVKGIPEIGDTIGKKVDKHVTGDFFNNRSVSQGVKHLWIVDSVVQRGLWYWLVFDVVNDFFYDWATAIMESHADDDCNFDRLLAYGPSDSSHALFGWNAPWASEIKYADGIGWDVIFTDLPPDKRYTVVFGLTASAGPGQGFDAEVGLFAEGTFTTPIELGGFVTVPGGGSGECLVSADIQGPQRVVIAFRNTFGVAFLTDIWVFIREAA